MKIVALCIELTEITLYDVTLCVVCSLSAYRSLSVLKCTFELYEIGTIKNGLVTSKSMVHVNYLVRHMDAATAIKSVNICETLVV